MVDIVNASGILGVFEEDFQTAIKWVQKCRSEIVWYSQCGLLWKSVYYIASSIHKLSQRQIKPTS